jgi:glycosyltransferase involved in cell wall biosynthesis
VHAYHARKGARWVLGPPHGPRLEGDAARLLALPLVVSFPGTDLNHDLDDPALGPVVRAAAARAARLLAHGPATLALARDRLPEHAAKLSLVPKGVSLPPADPAFDLRARARLGPGDPVVFLLPAGLRPVKDNLFCLAPLERVRAQAPAVRTVLAGPALDAAYAEEVRRRAAALEGARVLPALSPAEMTAAYAAAAVVLNTSVSEGYANTIAEAQAAGRPVLASDIPGNRGAVEHGVDGLLYRAGDEGAFEAAARTLALDPALRARLGAAGRARAERSLSPEAEAEAVLAAYRGAAGVPVPLA